jgi:putative transposase
MVNCQLWSNIKALVELKKNGRKVGKLRFKDKGWFKGNRLVLWEIKGVIVKRERSGKWHAIFPS